MTKPQSDTQPFDEQANPEDALAEQATATDDQLSAEDLDAIAGGSSSTNCRRCGDPDCDGCGPIAIM